jgi:hypothetical protein
MERHLLLLISKMFFGKKAPDPESGDFGRRIFYPFAAVNKRLCARPYFPAKKG